MIDVVIEHFCLRRHPFTAEIDVDGLYNFQGFQQGLMRLEQALSQRGSVLIVGEPGSGKTAMVRSFCKRLAASSYEVKDQLVPGSLVKNPARAVVDGFLAALGETIPFNNLARSIEVLKQSLRRLHEQGRQPVLLVDDVHHFTAQAWLIMKSLMNYELDSRMPVLFVFMGAQESALRTLSLSSLQEVKDRLGFCYHLRGLKLQETAKYLDKRMKWAGNTNAIFPTDIAEQIWRHSLGVPRRVNFLAANCLLAAACSKRELIDQPCLQQAISEMHFQIPQQEEGQ